MSRTIIPRHGILSAAAEGVAVVTFSLFTVLYIFFDLVSGFAWVDFCDFAEVDLEASSLSNVGIWFFSNPSALIETIFEGFLLSTLKVKE